VATEYLTIPGGVCAPKGFRASGVHCGIRKNQTKKDLALIVADADCAAAAVYTQNKVYGAPITVTRDNLKSGHARAMICNSGNANTCNADGVEKALAMCALVEKHTGISAGDVIVASTGVIGQQLDIAPIEAGMAALVAGLDEADGLAAAQAIMTTDTVDKQTSIEFSIGGKAVRIGAMAKGSGMIEPNMATLLGFVTTDAVISPAMLQKALDSAIKDSFNMVSIDGDTSTNDMVCVMASGLAANAEITATSADYDAFAQALKWVCTQQARMIAKDGEGATKLLTCHVTGAPCEDTARKIAKSVINSSLIKAMMFAADANFGRILCAIGYAQAAFTVDTIDVSFASSAGAIEVCENGNAVDFDEDIAKAVLSEDEVVIEIAMGQGIGEATAWGCDLTYDYVKINGSYRS